MRGLRVEGVEAGDVGGGGESGCRDGRLIIVYSNLGNLWEEGIF